MDIGKLRHRITIEQVTETQSTEGEPVKSWATFKEVWASIEPVSGKEYFTADQIAADVTHKINIRYLSGVIPKMRVSYGGRYFDILSVINFEEKNAVMQLMCKEDV